ncbi:signal peptidase I [Pseudonocardia humida]|uniref:signal peptidase I n=1 Tax=Pseudonocardia humida TaxID=2800819 RepID=UPI00207C2A8C|nr:signal peptidase I [Pseudonocardia humida]
MAPPELPDDRRATPRRYPPAETPVPVRHRADGGAPLPGHPPAAPGEPVAGPGGFPAATGHPNGNGAPANGAPPTGAPGNVAPNGRGPHGGPHGHPPHGAPDGHSRNGSAPPPAGRPLPVNGSGPGRPAGAVNGHPHGDPRRPGPGHPDGAFPGGPRRPEAARRGPAEPGGGARAIPPPTPLPPTQPPPGQLPAPRYAGDARPQPGGPRAPERTGAVRPPAPPSGPGGFPSDEPTEALRVDGAGPGRRSADGSDPDATEVIARAGRDSSDPAADLDADAGVDLDADDLDDLDDDRRASRRDRRRSGDTAGSRPAAEYKKQAEALARKKPRTGRRRRPAFWRELPLLVVVALLLTFLIQTFLAKVYVIPSGSMELTLHGCTGCNNDRVLVDKVTGRFADPEPGDVVVFRGPDSWSSEVSVAPPSNALVAGLQQLGSLIGIAPPDEKDFVKRIIAVGGQTVQCCDSRNRVMVDNQPLEEPYVYYLPEAGPPRQEAFGPVTVPQGQLWMMGDSRNNSSDSRVPGHGPVPVENVIGEARLVVLPIDRFGWIDSVDPRSTTAVGMGATGAGGVPLALGALFAVPLLRRGRRSFDPRAHRRDRLDGFLPDRRRWR